MEKGKMYIHKYTEKDHYFVVMCTSPRSKCGTFGGTVIKAYGTDKICVGDHNDYWACSLFEEHNELEVIEPVGHVIYTSIDMDEAPQTNVVTQGWNHQ